MPLTCRFRVRPSVSAVAALRVVFAGFLPVDESLVEPVGVSARGSPVSSTANRHWSSPSESREVRSARRPLTEGSIAFMKFTSNEHMTVVTSLASWRSKKSRKKQRRMFISKSPRIRSLEVELEVGGVDPDRLAAGFSILSRGFLRSLRVENMRSYGRRSTGPIACWK